MEVLDHSTSLERRRDVAAFGAFYTLSFTLALRGNETPMMDLGGLINHLNDGKEDERPHVVVPLLGKFKGEEYRRYHILLAPNITDSCFEPRLWLKWLVDAKKAQGIFVGSAFSDEEGYMNNQRLFNLELREQLE